MSDAHPGDPHRGHVTRLVADDQACSWRAPGLDRGDVQSLWSPKFRHSQAKQCCRCDMAEVLSIRHPGSEGTCKLQQVHNGLWRTGAAKWRGEIECPHALWGQPGLEPGGVGEWFGCQVGRKWCCSSHPCIVAKSAPWLCADCRTCAQVTVVVACGGPEATSTVTSAGCARCVPDAAGWICAQVTVVVASETIADCVRVITPSHGRAVVRTTVVLATARLSRWRVRGSRARPQDLRYRSIRPMRTSGQTTPIRLPLRRKRWR
jgi:hypothetical protein